MLDITKIHLLAVLIYTAASTSKKMIKRNLLLSCIRCNETCISYANTIRHPESSAYRRRCVSLRPTPKIPVAR